MNRATKIGCLKTSFRVLGNKVNNATTSSIMLENCIVFPFIRFDEDSRGRLWVEAKDWSDMFISLICKDRLFDAI